MIVFVFVFVFRFIFVFVSLFPRLTSPSLILPLITFLREEHRFYLRKSLTSLRHGGTSVHRLLCISHRRNSICCRPTKYFLSAVAYFSLDLEVYLLPDFKWINTLSLVLSYDTDFIEGISQNFQRLLKFILKCVKLDSGFRPFNNRLTYIFCICYQGGFAPK